MKNLESTQTVKTIEELCDIIQSKNHTIIQKEQAIQSLTEQGFYTAEEQEKMLLDLKTQTPNKNIEEEKNKIEKPELKEQKDYIKNLKETFPNYKISTKGKHIKVSDTNTSVVIVVRNGNIKNIQIQNPPIFSVFMILFGFSFLIIQGLIPTIARLILLAIAVIWVFITYMPKAKKLRDEMYSVF